jgi:hypothetical protein
MVYGLSDREKYKNVAQYTKYFVESLKKEIANGVGNGDWAMGEALVPQYI